MEKDRADEYGEEESRKRFDAALRGGLKTPAKRLKDKPKKKKAKRKKKPGK